MFRVRVRIELLADMDQKITPGLFPCQCKN
jgi:hypothetical protein